MKTDNTGKTPDCERCGHPDHGYLAYLVSEGPDVVRLAALRNCGASTPDGYACKCMQEVQQDVRNDRANARRKELRDKILTGQGEQVHGHCPMGCGPTLFLGSGGHVTCARLSCPNPSAVDMILDQPEVDHIVTFEDAGFNLLHPLKERLAPGGLDGCEVHEYLMSFGGPPVAPGKYRVLTTGRKLGTEEFAFVEIVESTETASTETASTETASTETASTETASTETASTEMEKENG
jgi:hypothetical protein